MCVMLGGQTANMAVPVVQHTGDAKPGGQHVKEEAPNDQQLFHELRPRSSEAVHPSTTLTELALIKAATVRMDTAEYSGEQKFQIPEDAPAMVAGGRKMSPAAPVPCSEDECPGAVIHECSKVRLPRPLWLP